MTREELLKSIEESLKEYNDLYQSGEFQKAGDLKENISQDVNKYTKLCREQCFAECRDAENPMHEACQRIQYDTIRLKEEELEDHTKVLKIVDAKRNIDLEKLHKFVNGGIGAESDWIFKAEKLNFLLTAKAAEELNATLPNGKKFTLNELSKCYAMKSISKQIEFGKNPLSNTNFLKTLNVVVKAMLGEEFKATSHDVAYLKQTHAKPSKAALKVQCSNHKSMRLFLMHVCHRILNGEKVYYGIESKEIKED